MRVDGEGDADDLDAADAAARALIVKHRPAVEAIVDRLLARGSLTGAEVAEMLAANLAQEAAP